MKPLAILFFGLIVLTKQVQAQDTTKYTALKVYTHVSLRSVYFTDETFQYIFWKNETQIGYITPALAFYKPNGDFLELELSNLSINSSDHVSSIFVDSIGRQHLGVIGEQRTRFAIGLRLENNFRLKIGPENARLRTFIGAAAMPSYSNEAFEPYYSHIVPASNNIVRLNLAVIPRINYQFTERLFLDVNIPITAIDMVWVYHKYKHPALSSAEQGNVEMSMSSFPPMFLLRAGLGVRIN